MFRVTEGSLTGFKVTGDEGAVFRMTEGSLTGFRMTGDEGAVFRMTEGSLTGFRMTGDEGAVFSVAEGSLTGFKVTGEGRLGSEWQWKFGCARDDGRSFAAFEMAEDRRYSQCVLVLETSIVSDRVDSREGGNDDLKTNAC